ncbi:MAG: hypothetical protein H0V89_04230 [Deltaproteobacteria bacterium]|nr:hypothetical protein [Deltaproteobacteria bacterium]
MTLESGETPPALLTGLSGSVIRLEGPGNEAIDLTVSADGTVTIDRAPFDAVAAFTFDWTGGVDLVEVDLSAGDWAVTWPDGTWRIVIKAEGAAGNYGVTLTGDATGLTGVVTDLFVVGDPPL